MNRCLPFCIVVFASLLSVPLHAQDHTNAEIHGRQKPKITTLRPSSGPVGQQWREFWGDPVHQCGNDADIQPWDGDL